MNVIDCDVFDEVSSMVFSFFNFNSFILKAKQISITAKLLSITYNSSRPRVERTFYPSTLVVLSTPVGREDI